MRPVASFVMSVTTLQVTPDRKALPGNPQLQQLIDGLACWMLLAALAGILIVAGVSAIAAHFNNHKWHARGKSGALVSASAAGSIDAAAPVNNFFVNPGSQVH